MEALQFLHKVFSKKKEKQYYSIEFDIKLRIAHDVTYVECNIAVFCCSILIHKHFVILDYNEYEKLYKLMNIIGQSDSGMDLYYRYVRYSEFWKISKNKKVVLGYINHYLGLPNEYEDEMIQDKLTN